MEIASPQDHPRFGLWRDDPAPGRPAHRPDAHQDATGDDLPAVRGHGCTEVKTDLSVSYIDHNMLQTDFRNADDHRYLQTVAAVRDPFPGRATASATVHLSGSAPGATLLGPFAHPTSGRQTAFAIGRAGWMWPSWPAPFYVPIRVVRVLLGRLLWVSAKDVILGSCGS